MTGQSPRTEAQKALRQADAAGWTYAEQQALWQTLEVNHRLPIVALAQARTEALDVEVLRAVMHDYEEWAHHSCDHSMFSYYGDDRAGYERNCTLAAQFIRRAILAGDAK